MQSSTGISRRQFVLNQLNILNDLFVRRVTANREGHPATLSAKYVTCLSKGDVSKAPIYFTDSFGLNATLIFLTHLPAKGYQTLIKSFDAVSRA